MLSSSVHYCCIAVKKLDTTFSRVPFVLVFQVPVSPYEALTEELEGVMKRKREANSLQVDLQN